MTAGYQAQTAGPGPLTRAALACLPRSPIKAGGPTKADLWRVDPGGVPLVIKDFAQKAAWVRAIGRVQIGRECRAYRWLGSQPGLARFVGRVDAHALAVAWIDGDLLARATGRPDGPELFAKLARNVERLHRSGFAHLDLRGRQNVILGRDGEVYVLDLASAVWFKPTGLPARVFARWFMQADRAALLKWKHLLGAGPLSETDRAFLRRWRFFRALWIFNRKGPRTPDV